jgi:hypothetical protein
MAELTWHADPTMLPLARRTAGIVQGLMLSPDTGKPLLTLREVPYSQAAMGTFEVGTSLPVPGLGSYPIPSGWCMSLPTWDKDIRSYTGFNVVCRSDADLRLDLVMHELWWHVFLTIPCHARSGFGGHGVGPGAPSWEGVPGENELVRWLHSVPVGSVPQ